MTEIGRLLIFIGIAFLIAGIILVTGFRVPFLGRLPGDTSFQIGGGSVTVLIGTSIALSILLTLVLNFLFRLFNR